MADIYMHSRLTEDLIARLDRDIDRDVAFLGAQGPDPMYYAVMHKQGKQYRYYADRMHDTDTQGLLVGFVEDVRRHNTNETYSFLVGFLAHYALDIHIHPYVYHHVGVYQKDDPKTHPWRGLHLKFERSIDCVLIERQQQIKPHKLALHKKHLTIKHAPKDVAELMGKSFQRQFGIDDGATIFTTCTRHMYNIVRYLATDRFGIKKLLYRMHDMFNREDDMFLADISFFHHVEPFDFLNEQHRTWHHPVTNESFTSSVTELYDQALVFATDMMTKVNRYLAGDDTIDLKTIFTNLSYNSGVACDHPQAMRHFAVYRP